MQQPTVRDVMTPEVLTVDYDMPPADVVTTMTKFDVSALAVADHHDSVLGVVTRTDVLKALAAPAALTWTAASAGQMMSAPAVTVEAGATPTHAGRLMRAHGVNRLLVTGPRRRLLGIVTAADLLKAHDRADEVIRAGLRRALRAVPAPDVALDVRDGVVYLAGTVTDRPLAELLVRLARHEPGVTAVRDEIEVDRPAVRPGTAEGRPGTAEGRPGTTHTRPDTAEERPRHRPLDGWWPTRHRRSERRPQAVSR